MVLDLQLKMLLATLIICLHGLADVPCRLLLGILLLRLFHIKEAEAWQCSVGMTSICSSLFTHPTPTSLH